MARHAWESYQDIYSEGHTVMSAMTPTALCNQMVADNHWSWDIYLDKDPNRHVAYMRLPLSPDESSKSYSRQMLLDSLAELAGLTVSVVTRLSHEGNYPAKVNEVVIDSLEPPLQKIVDWTGSLGFKVYEWWVFPPVLSDTETPIVAEGNSVADLLRALMKVESGKWIVVVRASRPVFQATDFTKT